MIEAIIKLLTLSPEKGAQTSIYLASSPAVAQVTGKYFVKCAEAQPSPEARDESVATRLWAESARLTGLQAEVMNH